MSNFLGKLFLIVGPSGVGKGTYIKKLKKRHPEWIFPVSATTREKRPREIDGETYYFFTKEEFINKRDNEEFLEWACVHEDNYYGILKESIFKPLEEGKIIIREIDIQGLESALKIIPKNNLYSIFLLPPSLEILMNRIQRRSPLSDEEVKKRMESAKKEIGKAKICDYKMQTTNEHINENTNMLEGVILNAINPN